MVISLVYWTLLTLFPHLILQLQVTGAETTQPTRLPEIPSLVHVPLLVDLALHVSPALSILADFFLFETKYRSKDVQVGASITVAVFALWYGLWVEYCGKVNGVCKHPSRFHIPGL